VVVLRVLVLCLAVFVAVPSLAAARPDAGSWTGPPAVAFGARAVVKFTVDRGTGLVQPVVRYRLRRCAGRVWKGKVLLGLVAVQARRFEVVARRRADHARIRLRLTGRFDSVYQAHGDLRGRVVRAHGGHTCRIPRLSWTAEQGGPTEFGDDNEIADEDLEDGEELEEDDFDENGEPIEIDEPPVDEGEDDDPGEQP
jgi:hypothetical protein